LTWLRTAADKSVSAADCYYHQNHNGSDFSTEIEIGVFHNNYTNQIDWDRWLSPVWACCTGQFTSSNQSREFHKKSLSLQSK
jgi:hypothetical protein